MKWDRQNSFVYGWKILKYKCNVELPILVQHIMTTFDIYVIGSEEIGKH